MAVMNQEEIKSIIPHREPFILVDEVAEIEQGKSIVAIKHVTGKEYFFAGHFPGNPVMPGVLIVEALAQAGAVVILGMDENRGKLALFAGIDNVKIKHVVKPGDDLVLKVELAKMRLNIAFAHGEAFVGGELACSCDIKCAVVSNSVAENNG